jgi:hypothetical protein
VIIDDLTLNYNTKLTFMGNESITDDNQTTKIARDKLNINLNTALIFKRPLKFSNCPRFQLSKGLHSTLII